MKNHTRKLRDEGEVTIDVNFLPDPPQPQYRIIVPAIEKREEVVFNVSLVPTDDPDVMNIYLENGAFVGTLLKPEPTT